MTVLEFEAQRAGLVCQHCGRDGLQLDRNANNGGIRPVCSACGSKTPIPSVQWLAQTGAADRKARRASVDPADVWEANGNHCAFCGKPRWLCERLRIGLTAQHLVPVVLGGEAGVLIPFCARCQEASVAALRETRNVLGEIESLDTIIQRIESKHPELRG